MSEDKSRFSVRVQDETKETLDDYKEKRNLNRSQAFDRVVEQWADLTDDGETHPEIVKTRSETTNNWLVTARQDRMTYIVASLLMYLVYQLVAVPTLVSVGMLALAGSWALMSVLGYYLAAADRIDILPTPTTAADLKVEA